MRTEVDDPSVGYARSTLADGHLLIDVAGDFTFAAYPALNEALSVEIPQATRITFDLSKAASIDEPAIGLMLMAQTHLGSQPVEVICIAGDVLNSLFRMNSDVPFALRRLDIP